ncbi:MAG: cysteine desulfurase family protein [Chlamydiota bacterium]
MKPRIYLDNNATTALDPKVIEVMIQDLSSPPSNPSSLHTFGQEAKRKLLGARQAIATYLKVKPTEIIFTSGGTESMNFLLKGLIQPSSKPHIITSNVEHSCVEKTLQDLENKGCEVTYLPATLRCFISCEDIEKAIQPHTKLLVFSAVNSETGVKQDLEALSILALKYNIPLVIDGVALLGKEEFSIPKGITGIGFSGHKFHGPKGAGFVFLRSHTKISPLLIGGGQEYGLRSGTENLTGILGLAKAVSLLKEKLPLATEKMQTLKDSFEKNLLKALPSIHINGSFPRICNVSNIAFPGVDAETLLIQLDLQGVAASHGSACSSGALEPSRILTRMGLSSSLTKSSLRFTLSRDTSQEEIDQTITLLTYLVKNLT